MSTLTLAIPSKGRLMESAPPSFWQGPASASSAWAPTAAIAAV